ncbi:DNA replication/repair protein RecF [Gammaproteobacteria bacterium AH-315-E17]|nr:DNA replication/repair protein RecF [Gammaproteobacteria bacterium AH-315-E17]
MPFLKKLSISKLRNLGSVLLMPSPGFNLIYGENGSGKTSLLEAIYLLGRGKTFRSSSKAPIIQNDAEECIIFAELNDAQSIGFSRPRSGEETIHINGEKPTSRAELAEALPLQMLNTDAFKILEGGPSVRRAYLDWGVFHVEHSFISHWRQAQKALLNRNSLLKHKAVHPSEISPWTHEFCQHAEIIHRSRNDYIAKLEKCLDEILSALMPLDNFKIHYFKGWDETQELEEVLTRNLQRDIKYGFTSAGPHRADIKIQIAKDSAADILSRGQQKLLVIAMKLAQATMLKRDSDKGCLFLVDDLPAELDKANRAKVLAMLAQIGEQVFVTGIEKGELYEPLQKEKELKLFHVEHGKIKAV